MAAPASAPAPAPTVSEGQLASATLTQVDPQRRFVRTAEAEFEVKDVYRTAMAIEDEVAAVGGFVVDNQIRSIVTDTRHQPIGNGRLMELSRFTVQGDLTVRVPSERMQDFLRGLAKQMEFLDHRSFQARDVQFDLLREQLARQRGEAAQQAIAQAGEEGGRLRDQVSAAQAQHEARSSRDQAILTQRELEDRIAFSTISLRFQQDPQVRTVERVDTDAVLRHGGPGFFKRLGMSLQAGWYGGLDAIVALAYLWPLWLFLLACVIAFRAWRIRRKRTAG